MKYNWINNNLTNMTPGEAKSKLIDLFGHLNRYGNPHDHYEDAINIGVEAIDCYENYKDFAEWVTSEIFDEGWDNNKDAFAEIACRKLEKLGLVKANGKLWETQTYSRKEN